MKRKPSPPRSIEQIIRVLRQAMATEPSPTLVGSTTFRRKPSTAGRKNSVAWIWPMPSA